MRTVNTVLILRIKNENRQRGAATENEHDRCSVCRH